MPDVGGAPGGVGVEEALAGAWPGAVRERHVRGVADRGARWRGVVRTASGGDVRVVSGPVVGARAVHEDFWRGPHADARLRSAAAEQSRACLEFTHAALSAWIVGVDEARETAAEDDDEAGDPGDPSRTAGLPLGEDLLPEVAGVGGWRRAARLPSVQTGLSNTKADRGNTRRRSAKPPPLQASRAHPHSNRTATSPAGAPPPVTARSESKAARSSRNWQTPQTTTRENRDDTNDNHQEYKQNRDTPKTNKK